MDTKLYKGDAFMDMVKYQIMFYNSIMLNPISTGCVALYNSLLVIAFKSGRCEKFTCANTVLQLMTGLSRQGLDKARGMLEEMKYIKYEKGTGNKAGVYTLVELDGNGFRNDDSCVEDNRHNDSTLYSKDIKHNNSNTITTTDTDTEKEKEIYKDKEKDKDNTCMDSNDSLNKVIEGFKKVGVLSLSWYERERLKELIDDYSEDWVLKSIKAAAINSNVKLSYILGILKNWRKSGQPILMRENKEEPATALNRNKPWRSSGERQYDPRELEKMLLSR